MISWRVSGKRWESDTLQAKNGINLLHESICCLTCFVSAGGNKPGLAPSSLRGHVASQPAADVRTYECEWRHNIAKNNGNATALRNDWGCPLVPGAWPHAPAICASCCSRTWELVLRWCWSQIIQNPTPDSFVAATIVTTFWFPRAPTRPLSRTPVGISHGVAVGVPEPSKHSFFPCWPCRHILPTPNDILELEPWWPRTP